MEEKIYPAPSDDSRLDRRVLGFLLRGQEPQWPEKSRSTCSSTFPPPSPPDLPTRGRLCWLLSSLPLNSFEQEEAETAPTPTSRWVGAPHTGTQDLSPPRASHAVLARTVTDKLRGHTLGFLRFLPSRERSAYCLLLYGPRLLSCADLWSGLSSHAPTPLRPSPADPALPNSETPATPRATLHIACPWTFSLLPRAPDP